jgi:hypothetical protein
LNKHKIDRRVVEEKKTIKAQTTTTNSFAVYYNLKLSFFKEYLKMVIFLYFFILVGTSLFKVIWEVKPNTYTTTRISK